MEPEYKSAPIPDEPTDGGVTVVVGKNFDKIVKDKTKDVLLEVRDMPHRYVHVLLLTHILAMCWRPNAHSFINVQQL